MWILTDNMIFSLYQDDSVEQEGKDIHIRRAGTPEGYTLSFGDRDQARCAWKKLQDAVKKGFQNVSLHECGTRRMTPDRKGRIF